MNLLPIQSFGTIEFRQLGGTGNIKNILFWINLILRIKNFAQFSIYDILRERILGLNTTSMYDVFTKDVFREDSPFVLRYNVNKELESGVIFVKHILNLSSSQYKETEFAFQGEFENSTLWKYIHNKGMKAERKKELKKKDLAKLSLQELEQEYLDATEVMLYDVYQVILAGARFSEGLADISSYMHEIYRELYQRNHTEETIKHV